MVIVVIRGPGQENGTQVRLQVTDHKLQARNIGHKTPRWVQGQTVLVHPKRTRITEQGRRVRNHVDVEHRT